MSEEQKEINRLFIQVNICEAKIEVLTEENREFTKLILRNNENIDIVATAIREAKEPLSKVITLLNEGLISLSERLLSLEMLTEDY